jgi:hypothetical protein
MKRRNSLNKHTEPTYIPPTHGPFVSSTKNSKMLDSNYLSKWPSFFSFSWCYMIVAASMLQKKLLSPTGTALKRNRKFPQKKEGGNGTSAHPTRPNQRNKGWIHLICRDARRWCARPYDGSIRSASSHSLAASPKRRRPVSAAARLPRQAALSGHMASARS